MIASENKNGNLNCVITVFQREKIYIEFHNFI